MTETESEFPKRVAYWFYLLLALGGLAFYLGWGIYYNSWNLFARENIGVYAVTVLMVGFGLTGMLLYGRKRQ